jgi:hypothetical protein
MMPEEPANPERAWKLLEFCRTEIRHEFNLMFSRFNVLLTCQSVLVVPLAILHTVNGWETNHSLHLFALVISGFGLASTILMFIPMCLAQEAIQEWLDKQAMIAADPAFSDYFRVGGGEMIIEHHPKRHRLSVLLPNLLCGLIGILWIVAIGYFGILLLVN